jgi:serine/threonine-protein phosphatase 6 regulatory ankyrin repeat subunit B
MKRAYATTIVGVLVLGTIIAVGYSRGHQKVRGFSVDPNNGANRDLLEAVLDSQPEKVRQLLSQGADADATFYSDSPYSRHLPMAFAAYQGRDKDMVSERQVFEALVGRMKNLNVQEPQSTLLMKAITLDDLDAVKLLVSRKVDVNEMTQVNQMNALDYALMQPGRSDVVSPIAQYLLDNGANPNLPGQQGTTILMRSAAMGRLNVITTLLAKGADPKLRDSLGRTALTFASTRRNTQLIALLQDRTPTTLAEAAAIGNVKKMADALSKGGDVNSLSYDGTPALVEAVKSENSNAVQWLLDQGASVKARDPEDKTALERAASLGNIAIMSSLLKRGTDINASSSFRNTGPVETALTVAVEYAQLNAVNFLLNHAPNLESHDQGFLALEAAVDKAGNPARVPTGSTPPWKSDEAMLQCQDQILKRLLATGSNLKARGGTLVAIAAKNGQVGIAKLLLDGGASANGRDDEGVTALCEAVDKFLGDAEMVDGEKDGSVLTDIDFKSSSKYGEQTIGLLIARGADVNLPNKDGQTPLMHCELARGVALAKALVAHGAKIDIRDNSGETALHHAAEQGDEQMMSFLIEHKAPVNVPDSSGYTPLMYAVAGENPDFVDSDPRLTGRVVGGGRQPWPEHESAVKLLISHGANPALRAPDGTTARSLARKLKVAKIEALLGGL